jgi:hypothetical protein
MPDYFMLSHRWPIISLAEMNWTGCRRWRANWSAATSP